MTVPTRRSDSVFNSVWRLLVRLTIITGVIFACYRLRSVITTIFIAAIIAYALDPMVEWMVRRPGFVRFHYLLAQSASGLQAAWERTFLRREISSHKRLRLHMHALRLYATLYTLVIAVIVLWQGSKLVVRPFVGEFKSAFEVVDKVNKKNRMQLAWEAGLHRYDRNPNVPEALKSDKLLSQLRNAHALEQGKQVAGQLASNVLPEGLKRLAEGLMSVVEIVLLPVLAFYFLVDGRKLKHEFISLAPRRWLLEAMRMVNEFNRIMRAFIVGQFLLCIIAGVVVGVGLALLRVPFPITLGVLAGITRAIPIVGPIIGGIPIVLLTLATKGPGVALAVLGFFTFLHFAESKFIMPMLIGDRMELHPVIVIVVLLIGGEVGGLLIGGSLGSLLGMFFAAPVASLVRVMLRRYWLGLKRPHFAHHPKISPPIIQEALSPRLSETPD